MSDKTSECDCPFCNSEGRRRIEDPGQVDMARKMIGTRHPRGTMVFWGDDDSRPWWVLEWQADNGPGCYWIVNAVGDAGTADENDVSLWPFGS